MSGRGRGRRRQEPPPPERRRTRSARRSRSPVDREEVHELPPRRRQQDPRPVPPPQDAPPAQPAPPTWWDQQDQPAGPNLQDQGQLIDANQGLLTMLLEKIENLEKMVLMKGDLIDALHLTVPSDTKQKICSGKYIDLSTLLVKNYQKLDDDSDKKLCGIQDKDGNITLKNVKKDKKDLTIDQWTTAFNTYMSVYLTTHKDELQGILAYSELIRGAARDHPNSPAWRLYDEHFRTKKAADPTRPWGMVDNQLWLALFCKAPQSNEKSKDKDQKDKKICFHFNSMRGCNNKKCFYVHKCNICEKSSHGSSTCFKRNQKDGNKKSDFQSNQKEKSKYFSDKNKNKNEEQNGPFRSNRN